MERIIGIDLGTTNTVVGYLKDGKPIIATGKSGQKLLPSVVGLSKSGELLVGTPARNQYVLEPENTVKSIKREMGSDTRHVMGNKSYLPQEISALILQESKSIAEEVLEEPVEKAVITVPAYFSDAQRKATAEAGRLAGLDVVRIINEPTAAALAYGLDNEEDINILVYDLGGGTFDVSIVEINSGVVEVLATAGNNKLGGDDFDEKIMDYLIDKFNKNNEVNLKEDVKAMARLAHAAERAKIELSDRPYVEIVEEFITTKSGKSLSLSTELSRDKFESLIADLLDTTLDLADNALEDAQLTTKDIDKILLVGGSTKIPMVSRLIEGKFNIEPEQKINPDECVALGAAIQAGIIQGEDIDAVLVDVAPYSLGVATIASFMGIEVPDIFSTIIKRNTAIPVSKSEVYTTSVDNQKEVKIEVYQGESPTASKNVLLGDFLLKGIRSAPAGEPKIIVTFDYDINGIVHIRAQDKDTKVKKEITLKDKPNAVTTKDDNASKKSSKPSKKKLNEVKMLIKKAKKLLKEAKSNKDIKSLKRIIKVLEESLANEDINEINKLSEKLLDIMYEFEN